MMQQGTSHLILNNDPHTPFPTSPPSPSPSILLAQPPFSSKVLSELLDSLGYVAALAYIWWQPVRVMKRGGKAEEWDYGGEFVQEKEGDDAGNRGVAEWGCITLQELGDWFIGISWGNASVGEVD